MKPLENVATVYTYEGNRIQIFSTETPMEFYVLMNGNPVSISWAVYQMNRAKNAEQRIKTYGVTA